MILAWARVRPMFAAAKVFAEYNIHQTILHFALWRKKATVLADLVAGWVLHTEGVAPCASFHASHLAEAAAAAYAISTLQF